MSNGVHELSAYVHWSDTNGNDHFIEHIQFIMSFYGQTVHVAVIQAAGYNDDQSFLNNNMKVYGYWDLTLWAFNN